MGCNQSHSAGIQHSADTYPWMLLLLLKADMLSQGHQMLPLSSVYSSDVTKRHVPGAGMWPKTGNAMGA